MALNPQYSRISHHAITTAGATFSVPPGEDFTIIGGTLSWNVTGTELADREFGLNITDNKAYLRIGSNINELLFVGGTANDQSFAETLAINNNSQTYNIIMGTATIMKSINGGGQIELDSTANGGGPGSIYLSTDNGLYTETGMFLEPGGNGAYIYSYDGSITLETNASGISLIESGPSAGQLKISTSWLSILNDSIFIKNNLITSVTSSNSSKTPVSISSQNSSFSPGVYNSVILGGYDDVVSTSNTLSLVNRKYGYASASTTSATTSTIASIPMSDGQTMTIHSLVNAVTTSPNRNLGIELFAVFLKYGGTIYQTSTTDVTAKDGYGDGSTATIDTDGTNVRIRVTSNNSLTINWKTSYDYLLTS